jgi:hypothetical protein
MATLSTFDDFCVGDELFVPRSVEHLLTQINSVTLGISGVPGSEVTVNLVATDFGQILDQGALQDDSTYTAEYVAILAGGADGYTHTYFTPGVTTRVYVQVMCTDGTGPYTAALIDFTPKRGGMYG